MEQTVFIIDDDRDIREMLQALVESVGLTTELHEDAEDFLNTYRTTPGCIVTDIRLKGMSGLMLQENLRSHGNNIPIILMTGHADIPMTIRAMKQGATDFFTKPFNNQLLLESIQNAVNKSTQLYQKEIEREKIRLKIKKLTLREFEVMQHMVEGALNKVIAFELGISMSTVEAHRAQVMKKMNVKSLAELIKIILSHPTLVESQ